MSTAKGHEDDHYEIKNSKTLMAVLTIKGEGSFPSRRKEVCRVAKGAEEARVVPKFRGMGKGE